MFRAVVPQVVETLDGLFVPASDIDALIRLQEIGFLDVGFGRPSRGAVQVLGVYRECLGASQIQEKKDGARGKRPAHNDSRADEQWKFDSNICRAAFRPYPHKPFIRRVKRERADAEQGGTERGLILETPSHKLCGNYICQEEADKTHDCRRPVEPTDEAGICWLSVSS